MIILIILIIFLIVSVSVYLDIKFINSTVDNIDTKNFTINALFLVRDGEKYLLNNLNKIESFCKSNFSDYRIFFLENDSVDSTRQILSNKMSTNNKIKGIFKKINDLHSTKLCKDNILNYNCNTRTRFLASLRQELLEYSLKEPSDITLMCDLDFISFNDTELLRMVRILIDNNLDGVFGMSYSKGKEYDTGAIRPYDQNLIDKIVKGGTNIIQVDSAFSGFGVYSTKSITSKKAKYNLNNNSIEHIDFNKYFDKLYVYPNFKPDY